jgi:signal transduction histidine kinase
MNPEDPREPPATEALESLLVEIRLRVATAEQALGHAHGLMKRLEPAIGAAAIPLLRDRARPRAQEAQLLAPPPQGAEQRTKHEFLADVTHELRTTLEAILGWAELMHGEECGSELHRTGLAIVEDNARAQARLVTDLLDEELLARGHFHLEICQLDLHEIVRAGVEALRPAAVKKGVALFVHPTPCRVIGDPLRLEQVARNLLANAIKFTPVGGHVDVRIERRDPWAILEVQDDGDGIPAELLPYVFERYRQGVGSSRQGGFGLGLSIVRRIVELHRGHVHATSDGPGRGARFSIDLPLVEERPAARPPSM